MIKVENLSLRFANKSILEHISFHIEQQLTIVGANGSGKSSLAKCIAGLYEYKGNIILDGSNATELSAKKRAQLLSYIPAKLEVYDAFITVEEFVLLGRFAHKKSLFEYAPQDKAIAKEMLEYLGLSHLAKEQLQQLSSGQQQLTLIAQALTQQSQIIIFDEPTANLDPKNSRIIAKEIKKLQQKHTVVLITHDLHLAAFIGADVLFLADKGATLYKEEFFNDTLLAKLYGVPFSSLAVRYE